MTPERRDLWRCHATAKQLCNTLLPFHNVYQIESHQKRMLTVTVLAMKNDVIDRHSIFTQMRFRLIMKA